MSKEVGAGGRFDIFLDSGFKIHLPIQSCFIRISNFSLSLDIL